MEKGSAPRRKGLEKKAHEGHDGLWFVVITSVLMIGLMAVCGFVLVIKVEAVQATLGNASTAGYQSEACRTGKGYCVAYGPGVTVAERLTKLEDALETKSKAANNVDLNPVIRAADYRVLQDEIKRLEQRIAKIATDVYVDLGVTERNSRGVVGLVIFVVGLTIALIACVWGTCLHIDEVEAKLKASVDGVRRNADATATQTRQHSNFLDAHAVGIQELREKHATFVRDHTAILDKHRAELDTVGKITYDLDAQRLAMVAVNQKLEQLEKTGAFTKLDGDIRMPLAGTIQKVEALEKEIQRLDAQHKADVSTIAQGLDDASTCIESLTKDMDAQRLAMVDVTQKLDKREVQAAGLAGKMSKLESDLSADVQSIARIFNSIGAHRSAIDKLERDHAAFAERIRDDPRPLDTQRFSDTATRAMIFESVHPKIDQIKANHETLVGAVKRIDADQEAHRQHLVSTMARMDKLVSATEASAILIAKKHDTDTTAWKELWEGIQQRVEKMTGNHGDLAATVSSLREQVALNDQKIRSLTQTTLDQEHMIDRLAPEYIKFTREIKANLGVAEHKRIELASLVTRNHEEYLAEFEQIKANYDALAATVTQLKEQYDTAGIATKHDLDAFDRRRAELTALVKSNDEKYVAAFAQIKANEEALARTIGGALGSIKHMEEEQATLFALATCRPLSSIPTPAHVTYVSDSSIQATRAAAEVLDRHMSRAPKK